MKHYWKFLRPFTLVPPALGMVSGSLIAIKFSQQPFHFLMFLKIFAGGLIASLLNGASNGINQIFDKEIDSVNKPERPLISGKITDKQAWGITLFCYFTSMVLAFFINITLFYIVSFTAFLTVIYSAPPIRTKKHWLLATITISLPRGMLLKLLVGVYWQI